jgi:anti-sigma factor ChrR (cupin superfamily)
MKCKYSETDLALYVEGDVVSAKACEIQAHLSVCTQCRDLVIELRESQRC